MATKEGGIDADTLALRTNWFRQLLGTFPTGSMIDLGSGHGMFAVQAADLGWTVTALDARGDRYPNPPDPRIDWRVGDVRDADLSGYDVIACLGLFYHLTAEDQVDLLRRAQGTPIILDTHVANGKPSPFELSDVVVRRGYRGRMFRELGATHSTASWGNAKSFWATRSELLRMLADHGYDVLVAAPWYLPTRTFFLCLPAPTTEG